MAKKCKGKWINSEIQIDSDFKKQKDGEFEIKTENDAGDLTGTHTNVGAKTVEIFDAKCSSGHIKFSREEDHPKEKEIWTYTYTGTLDGNCEENQACEIKNGRVKIVKRAKDVKISNDDGDWTAQRPITLRTERK